jgi:dihydropteroate synthase
MSVPRSWHVRGRVMPLDRPLVMGIVNVTPDSFSDGGEFLAPADALTRVRAMVADGADLIDVGGESTRPHGARAVTIGEELARVLPVVRAIAAGDPRVVISVDTVKSEVAEAALDAGAHVVNDVSALRLDPRMARVIARTGAGAILMHSRGGVADMGTYLHADYDGDVLDAVERELASQLAVARDAGIPDERLAIDPGLGFAKRPEDSLRVLACLARVARLGYPVVVGASRKRLIGSLTGVPQPAARVHGSVGAALAAYERGAAILRVHDVRATRQALDVAAAVRRAEHASPCAPVA